MRIAIVSEIKDIIYRDEFPWTSLWTEERQIKYNCAVSTVVINPSVLSNYTKESPYWDSLRKADLIFIYCTRTQIPQEVIFKDIYGRPYRWDWWVLPKYVKLIARPDAKIICQWDDEFIWLYHPDWVWWQDRPLDRGGPNELFEESKIFNYMDMVWTVLENPLYASHCNKPIRYMPLPYLYGNYLKALKLSEERKDKERGKNLVLMRHTSAIASIENTITEIAEPLNIPVVYFSTCWSNPDLSRQFKSYKVPVQVHLHFEPPQYMATLLDEGYIAIDDADNYIGWSRFAMECAMNYIPCVGSTYAVKLFFPELYTEHNDFAKQYEKVNKLVKDPDFYKRMAEEGHKRCLEHLDPDRICQEVLKIAKELGVKETKFDPVMLREKKYFVPSW